MTSIFISEKVKNDLQIYTSLYNIFDRVVLIKPNRDLPYPTQCHADMSIFKLGSSLLTTKKYFEFQKQNLESYPFILSDEKISNIYPKDILFNCFFINNFLVAKSNCISDKILDYAKKNGKNIIPVSQGYAKCSCAVAGNCVITADIGMFKTLKEKNIECLLISSGNIDIEDYNFGFIGGASFFFRKTLYFLGNIEKHPDFLKILNFCTRHYISIQSLSDSKLFDYGGAVIFD